MRYTGLVLDFETLQAGDVDAQVAVVRAIADSAQAHGVTTLAVAIPAEPDAAYPTRALAAVADFVLVMLYDQHWSGWRAGTDLGARLDDAQPRARGERSGCLTSRRRLCRSTGTTGSRASRASACRSRLQCAPHGAKGSL